MRLSKSKVYRSKEPVKIGLAELTEEEKFHLMESENFCMYPWIHLHAYPDGRAYPCCSAKYGYPLGSVKENTMEEVWNNDNMKKLRIRMLNNKPSKECTKCYEQEKSGFFSLRQSANQHFGHNIKKIHETKEDGTFDRFEMTYWDIRFSNLCNFSCRSCGIPFSSNWHEDHVKIHGPTSQPKVVYAGKTKTDAMDQLMEHLPYLEQVYFAGGEPLIMEEHYIILNELIKQKKTDVRLIYNTNFSRTAFKSLDAIDMWKHFKDVSIGASLDAMGSRAELMRKGTKWSLAESNRERMLDVCPHVDFYISPTLSILNVFHLPDFHKDWVTKGFLRPADLNVNILQDPIWYRIDLLPLKMKQEITEKYKKHIEWLRPRDPLTRAVHGFESAIKYMNGSDKQKFLPMFVQKTNELDGIRKEKTVDVFPELESILNGS
tara:strand:- start:661 stop:1956 length:1296 start_codon:yes stop_codon:yes gene_type:complete